MYVVDIAVTEQDLRALFVCHGEVESNDGIILFRKDIPGYTNYAHINFRNRESATAAKAALNQYELFGRFLRVEWNRSHKKLNESSSTTLISTTDTMMMHVPTNSNDDTTTDSVLTSSFPTTSGDRGTYVCCPVLSVYVQFETIQEGVRVSEATIRSVFEPFGFVTGTVSF
jgi:RNA recognition motif-containing protein